MPAGLTGLSRVLPALLPLLLFGCGPGRNEFAPPCPNPAFLRDLADLKRYRSGGPGKDLTDLVLQARLVSLNGKCSEDSKRLLETSITVTVEVTRGPAMQGRQIEVPVFVAVVDGEEIPTKQIFPLLFEFPPNVDRAIISSPPIQLSLPITAQKSGAAYGIIAGFQLTPEELELNRRGRPKL